MPAPPQRPPFNGRRHIRPEFARLLDALGHPATLPLRKDRLLRAFDAALGDEVMTQMREAGVDIRTGEQWEEITRAEDGTLGYRAGEKSGGGLDCVLFAISRHANTAELALEKAGIAPERGFVPVDEFQNNAAEGVYALGDATPAVPLTPVAIAARRRPADRLFGGKSGARLNYEHIPTVVFSHPPIGRVGMSEESAAEAHGTENIRVYQSRFVNMRYALGAHKPKTLVKLVTAGADEKVVGCHVAGDGADEMMQGFAVAIKMGARKADLDDTVAIHPTAAEELVTLR